uniref:UDP-glucuronosyltransferase n=1 Tax=Meloidogyne incognita TaxID=6306 RepID=A0A914MXD3_MELIC
MNIIISINFSYLFFNFFLLLNYINCLNILQIVPGFTNSHVLFNYRLAEELTKLGHSVVLWTQMEMNMVFTGDFKLPDGVNEIRESIQFKDKLKVEGLKVFQEMIFESGTPYELWWTGREFKEMRLEACEQMLGEGRAKLLSSVKYQKFDLAIGHFHDFCPVAMARSVGVSRIIWITHGPSLYDFTSLSLGLQTFPSFVPHPLSFNSDRMNFLQRLINVIWHYSGIEFVNLPNVLLHEENSLYKKFFPKSKNLWSVGQQVSVLLLNGERFLDFPRPLPTFILNLGSLASKQQKLNKLILDPEIEYIYSKKESKGVVIFSMGTVSNTTNMPLRMTKSFLNAFGRIPEYDFLWKTEQTEIEGIGGFKNVHLRRWINQKELIKHPKTRLLFAHGGYSSFLEAAKAGIPILLVPLFADQGINAKRAQRFGICEILDKKTLNEKIVEELLRKMLSDNRYHRNARKLSAMLADNPPSSLSMPSLEYGLRLAVSSKPDYFSLKSAKKLGFLEYFNVDLIIIIFILIYFMTF